MCACEEKKCWMWIDDISQNWIKKKLQLFDGQNGAFIAIIQQDHSGILSLFGGKKGIHSFEQQS